MKKIGLILVMIIACLVLLTGCNNSTSNNGTDSVEDRPSPYETDGWW